MKTLIKSQVRDYKVSDALMPLYEAISNSIHAIERYGINNGEITITLVREDVLPEENKEAAVVGFKIEDNGIGFTEGNIESFDTAGSDQKEDIGGKGNGRFSWLKVFEYVRISSICNEDGQYIKKVFRFDNSFRVENIKKEEIVTSDTGTTLSLNNVLPKFAKSIPKNSETIAKRIIIHFMDFFIGESGISISLVDKDESVNLKDFLQEFVQGDIETIPESIGGNSFDFSYIKLSDKLRKDSFIALTATGRAVKEFKISQFIPDVDDVLAENDEILCVWVASPFLTKCALGDRTDFNGICEEKEKHVKPDEMTYEEILEPAINKITKDLAGKQEELDQEKSDKIETYIRTNAAHYMYLLKKKDQLSKKVSYSDVKEEKKLENRLHDIYQEELREVKKETLLATENFKDGKSDEFVSKINEIIERYSDIGQAELARYIAHRKAIIEIFHDYSETLIETDNANVEADLHRIIFPVHKESHDIPYETHNLWLLDERFNFHYLLASDKQFNQIPLLDMDCDDRADILAILGDMKDGSSSSIFIAEFKRPQKNNYDHFDTKYHPNKQILRYVKQIRDGEISGTLNDRNRKISVKKDAPAHAIIVADITPNLFKILDEDAFTHHTNNRGDEFMFKMDDKHHITYFVYPYQTLINDAKERNRIFFEKLGI